MNLMEGLEKYKHTENAVLIDVRETYEFALGSVPDAVNIPLSTLENIKEQYPEQTLNLFVFCRSGVRAKKAKEQLIEMGYQHVYDIGGYIEYEE